MRHFGKCQEMAVLLLSCQKWKYILVMSKKDTIKKEAEELKDFQNNQVQSDSTENKEEVLEEIQEDSVDELEELQIQVEKEKDRNLRLFAEFENFRKRTARERIELFKTAGEEIMLSLLPVLDDFERALKEHEKREDDGYFTGVKLIYNKFRDTLQAKGLEPIEVKPGDTFDVDTHEAVTKIPAPEKKLKGKIVDAIERGYTLNGKIIRYPKVVVGE